MNNEDLRRIVAKKYLEETVIEIAVEKEPTDDDLLLSFKRHLADGWSINCARAKASINYPTKAYYRLQKNEDYLTTCLDWIEKFQPNNKKTQRELKEKLYEIYRDRPRD